MRLDCIILAIKTQLEPATTAISEMTIISSMREIPRRWPVWWLP